MLCTPFLAYDDAVALRHSCTGANTNLELRAATTKEKGRRSFEVARLAQEDAASFLLNNIRHAVETPWGWNHSLQGRLYRHQAEFAREVTRRFGLPSSSASEGNINLSRTLIDAHNLVTTLIVEAAAATAARLEDSFDSYVDRSIEEAGLFSPIPEGIIQDTSP